MSGDWGRVVGIEESVATRQWRRYRLAAIDSLLNAIEEHNYARGGGEEVADGLVFWYRVLAGSGSTTHQPITGAALWERTLALQTNLLIAPALDPARPTHHRRTLAE